MSKQVRSTGAINLELRVHLPSNCTSANLQENYFGIEESFNLQRALQI